MTIFSSLYTTRLDRELGTDDSTVLCDVLPCVAMQNVPHGCLAQTNDARNVALWNVLGSHLPYQADRVVAGLGESVGGTIMRLTCFVAFLVRVVDVIARRAKKEMRRIAARRIVAGVANVVAMRNGFLVRQYPCDPVRANVVALAPENAQKAIAIRRHCSGPRPAFIWQTAFYAVVETTQCALGQVVRA